MRSTTVGALILACAAPVAMLSCSEPAAAKDYGQHGAMGHGPLRPFDESTPIPRAFKCEGEKCTLSKKDLADLIKRVYEEGKVDAQNNCGSRT